MILLLSAISSLHAADPASGTISVSGPAVTWNGQTVAGAETTEANCMEGLSCDTFKLTLSGSPADWNGRVVNVGIKWMSGTEASDYDMYIHKGAPNGPIVATSVQTPSRSENAAIEPDVHGTGDYYIHVAAYIAAGAADPYNGTATSADPLPRLDPAPQATNVVAPRFQIHAPTNEQLAAGFGRDAAEPSIGVNWNTGSVFYQAMLQTLRVRFDDSCVSSPRATWEDKSPVTSSVITFDPILYTDRDTGRTFASQLLFPTTDSATSYTTTDGESWIPSQGAGISSGVDHQTLGGGPFHAPLTGGVGLYPNAVYYCAQNIADANCALSLDGGQTFGPAIPLYTVDQCAGLHGHVKVAPDGTVYVPNPACGGELLTKTSQAVLVSEDNGLTWDIRTVPDADASGSDPSVAVGANGRLYFGFSDGDGAAGVSVSDDRGLTWYNTYDVGSALGIKHSVFPAFVAGDNDRAAVAFYGTTTQGAIEDGSFNGEWNLYIAATRDGGAHWTTVNATPNDPMQRGAIWLSGGGIPWRNLLDFMDATIDKQGRILVGYNDGCLGPCNQTATGSRGNSYTATTAIARQTGGFRMFGAYDPPAQNVPGAPAVTVTRDGSVATITWSPSDDGGSPISGYKLYRRDANGSESLLASLGAGTLSYIDSNANPANTYSYRVVAANALGSSCSSDAVTSKSSGSSCAGMKVANDAKADQTGAPVANADLDIESITISEPYFEDGSATLVMKMKVADLSTILPNRQWRVIWNFPSGPADQNRFEGRYYAGMNSDASGVVSFEYGIAVNDAPTLVNTFTPLSLGAIEGSYTPDGTITLLLPKSSIGNLQPGDLIGGLFGGTFAGQGLHTMRSNGRIDSATISDTYRVVGNETCKPKPLPSICLEDDDAALTYGNAWHLGTSSSASSGHFRYTSAPHGLSLTVDVPQGATGSVTYHYATSPKGGSADVYIDGVFRESVSFAGAGGSTRAPQFGSSRSYSGLSGGRHTLELRNLKGVAYVDRFCIDAAASSGSAAAAPGTTTNNSGSLLAGTSLVNQLAMPANAQSLSVIAESNSVVPMKLVVLDPNGNAIGTADSVNGIATLNVPVSGGNIYAVKVINVSLGPVQVWTAATPLLKK